MKFKYLILIVTLLTLNLQCAGRRRMRSIGKSRSINVKADPRFQNMTLHDFLIAEPEVNDPQHVIKTQNGLSYTVGELLATRKKSWTFIYIFGTIALCLICCCFPSCGSSDSRANQIKQVTDEFELANSGGTSLSQNQRGKSIEKLMIMPWKVKQTFGSTSITNTWQLKIKSLKKKTDLVYEIEGIGQNEDHGNSWISGVVLFKGNEMAICFDKLYKDRRKAGQMGKLNLLIFEGFENEGEFVGNWYYKGFKKDDQYSGALRIVPT